MEYIAEDTVRFTGGRFRLSPDQLRRRRHLVQEVAPGIYEPVAEIQFKAGERINADSELPKDIRGLVSVARKGSNPPPPPAASKPQAPPNPPPAPRAATPTPKGKPSG